MPIVLITGAAGFIGMHTSIRFLKEGWDVIGLDNLNDYCSVKLKLDRLNEISNAVLKSKGTFEFFEADLNSGVWQEFEPIDFNAVVHLAAQAGVRYSIENPRAYLESNILGFQSVIEFVSRKEIERFLYASSSSVYGMNSSQPFSENACCDSPESYYASTKRANELMAKSYFHTGELSSIGLRFFTVYGPWGRPDMAPILFANAAKKERPIKVFNHGNQKRDFTFIDDIIEGIFRLTTLDEFPRDSLVVNIGNGAPVELMKFISLIEREMQVELDKEYVNAQKGDVAVTCASTKILEELTGYKPVVNLEDGIRLFIDWFKTYDFES
jgi:UDP-glucuronate 4-epimerase